MQFCRNTFVAAMLAIVLGASTICFARPSDPPTSSPTSSPTTAPGDEEADDARVDPKRVSFDASIPSQLEVRKSPTGHLLVPAKINGKLAGWFILDTGAGMSCIDKDQADALNLPLAGDIMASGTGGERASKLRNFDTLSVGPVVVETGVLLELNLKPFAIFMGPDVIGIIGHECFDGGVFDIDLANATASVFDPATFQLEAKAGSWQPLTIVRRRPTMLGTIEGSEAGAFVLDTGSNESVLVHSPTVKKLKLLDGRKTRGGMSGGVGGMKKVRSGKLSQITLGSEKMSEIAATFSEADSGATSSDELATVGIGLLRNFRMIVNQPAGKIALVRVQAATTTQPANLSTQPSTDK